MARAIAKGGFDETVEAQLFEQMKNEVLMNDAALALILGGSPETAARARWRSTPTSPRPPSMSCSDLWYRSFGYWSTEDLESAASLFKYVDNAEAISRESPSARRRKSGRA